MLGFYPVRVLPSKTAIIPVNPTFLPQVYFELLKALGRTQVFSYKSLRLHRLNIYASFLQSEDEREMCARTIYCTNIDKKVDVCVPVQYCLDFFYDGF